MIGNDIVDLEQASRESNWRRKGYIDKLFTRHEQQLIFGAPDPDRMVWLLWSMKESAYKLAVRQTKNRAFAPVKLECSVNVSAEAAAEGYVLYGESYQTKSLITSRYIATVAFAANTTPSYSQVIIPFDTADYQRHSDLLRQKLRQHGSALFQTSPHKICIDKDSLGIPVLAINNSATLPVSISHHGYYGAYVIGL
ncbi:4'-phosphopantetheinyl transferase family protein [Spirosoma radiotolerans]|uniref:4'-phosphopantetheinyl transferase domain-containing protein n=1 Tax=Spirosoma radiotolerans TaxID=1379870 RepID=A0A0E3V828_9BACT|nr:4'-phosphopantetheinyl transferase superfamily protein [Spirosoma radiotolerans]AKD56387.1 hypothetical protein SD10_17195 [Spirosoma radiotolerans]